jgi:Tol biopolymer transport system component
MSNSGRTKSIDGLCVARAANRNTTLSLGLRLCLLALALCLGPFLAAQPILVQDFETTPDPAIWSLRGGHTAILESNPHGGSRCLYLKGADHEGGFSGVWNRNDLNLDDALIEFWFRDLLTQQFTGGSPGFMAVYLTGSGGNWLGTLYQMHGEDMHFRHPGSTPDGQWTYAPNVRINNGVLSGWHKLGIRYAAGPESHVRIYLNDVEVLTVALGDNPPLADFLIGCGGQYDNWAEAYVDDIQVWDLSDGPNGDLAGKIVFSATATTGGQTDIYAVNPDGSGLVNLTLDFDAPAWSPRISPDGRKIAFGSNSGGNGLWVMNADGSGKTKLAVAAEPYGPGLGNWLGNNTLIYYSGPASSTGVLRAVDLDGANNRVLVNNPLLENNDVGMDPRYSVAANQIVFLAQVGSYSPSYDLYLANADGSNPRVFFADPADNHMDRNPIWSRDGQTIYWSRPPSTGVNHNFGIVRRALSSTQPTSLFDASVWPYVDVVAVPQATSPDDQSLLVSLSNGQLVLLNLQSGIVTTLVAMASMGSADWSELGGSETALVIASQPQNQLASFGETVTFQVQAAGSEPMEYQWYHNGNTLAGASSSSLTITGFSTAHIGYYQVRISNSQGEVFSDEVMLIEGMSHIVGWGDSDFSYVNWPNHGQWASPDDSLNIVDIAAGWDFSLGLRDNATVYGWGNSAYGKTTPPPDLGDVVQVSAGAQFALALTSNGHVIGWGRDQYGELTLPSGLVDIVQIAAGSYHALALKSDGTVVGWGYNEDGQADPPAGLQDVVAIAAGYANSMALRSDGTVVVWGRSTFGALNVPAGLTEVVQIAVGSDHCMALTRDGRVYCWGLNREGQCNVPSGLSNVTQISAGSFHSMALKSDGQVVCWGGWGFGRVQVPADLQGVTRIAAGGYHSLALIRREAVTFIQEPLSQQLPLGANAVFTARAVGTQLIYQWRKNGVNLSDGGRISGATTATLSIVNVQASDAGSYDVVVSNSAGSATSQEASLTVGEDPILAGRIVFSATEMAGGQMDIYVINPDGSGLVNLTADFDAPSWSPRISPDGRKIAFGSNGGGNGLWVMNADGTGKTKLAVAAEPYGPGLGNWLGNNTLIYYSGPASSTGRLRAVDLDGSNNRVLVNNPLFENYNVGVDPRYSAAANQIVFLAQQGSWSPTYDLYLANADGSNPRVFFEDPDDDTMDRHPIWSRDGRTVYWSRSLATGVNQFFEIVRRSLDSTQPMGEPDAILLPYAGVSAVPQVTSPDDKSLLASLSDGRLVLIDLDSGRFETITQFDSIGGADWAATLSVLVTEDFPTWIARWDLPPDKQDPADRNGPLDLPNLLAYALGVNPFTAQPGDLPVGELREVAGQDQFVFVYRQSKTATGIEVQVVENGTVAEGGWLPVWVTPAKVGDTSDGLAELWQVLLPVDSTHRFFRLNVR